MKKISYRSIAAVSAVVCAATMFASCGGSSKKTSDGNVGEASGYTYGINTPFHSEEPVTYTLSFSDASWYPMVDTWETEGVFKKIEELTNVHLDISSYDSGDYTQKINLAINAGAASYIIPKVYSEEQYVSGGGIIAVSDYTKYMPNFNDFVKKYDLEEEFDQIKQADGKFYRLPGLHQMPLPDYTLLVREDIFQAAGYNIRELEKNWTWEDLHDILVGVKAYMVKQGMIKSTDYVWSDLWCGETGQGSGGALLNFMANTYNVTSGWGITGSNGGIRYDWDKKEYYSSSVSDDYKKFITVANSFIKDGLLDPETFTQQDQVAHDKFYRGDTVIMSTNRGQYASDVAGVKKILGDSAKVYVVTYPTGTNKEIVEKGRFENGVVISQRALDELGEKDFVKMMRFVDWLFYSSDAYQLIKWGPENETWHYVDVDGVKTKQLLPGFKCSGLGISGKEDDVDIRLQWGYAGGNFYYGHSTAELTDNFIPELRDLMNRFAEYRSVGKLSPAVQFDEDQKEQLNLWAVPLIDNINTWTLKFIIGQKDINKDWTEYVNSCKNLNIEKIIKMTNETAAKQSK